MTKILALSVALFAAGSAWADCKRGGWGYHHGGQAHGNLFLNYAEELGLTDKQVGQLNRLRLDHQNGMSKFHEKMSKQREELSEISHSKNPDRKKIEAAADKLGQTKAEKIKLKALMLLDARAVLTEKQQRQLDEIYKKTAAHYGHHGQMGMAGEPPSEDDDY